MQRFSDPVRVGWWTAIAVAVVLLCLALLPVLPVSQNATADLDTVSVEPASQLLGENGASPDGPTDARQASGDTTRPLDGNATLSLTVPKLGLKDVKVPTGATQKDLDREGIIHTAGSGVPWQDGSNTFIAGHALGFMRTRVPYVFYELDRMRPGDEVLIADPSGKQYTFRVFDQVTVQPSDYWVTYPDREGRTIVSLQSCTPIPTFENRLIVQAELVS